MHGALASLFKLGGEAGRDADVFLITDGEVWNAEEIVALARTRDQRVFVIAAGSIPAESLLARLVSRQRSGQKLFPVAQVRADLAKDLRRSRCPRGHVFEYIEMFYNPVRHHGHTDRLSAVEFERRTQTGSNVSRARGDSLS